MQNNKTDEFKKLENEELRKKKEQEAREREKMELLSKANEVRGEQLTLSTDGQIQTEDEIRKYAVGDFLIDDPKTKFDLYYKGISKLLRENLPKGKQYETAREYIFEEKKTFMTRGHRKGSDGTRGADSRMGYIEDAEKILDIIVKWVQSGGAMTELFMTLRDLNKEMGYGERTNFN